MVPPEQPSKPPDSSVETAIQRRLASIDAGNYRSMNELVLSEFATFLKTERGVTTLEELEVLDCRRYAQHLRDRANDPNDELSAASAHEQGPYFAVVRAFLSWCVADERLEKNPAKPNRVQDALPEHHGETETQFWSPDTRTQLLQYVDARVHAAMRATSEGYHDRQENQKVESSHSQEKPGDGKFTFSDPPDVDVAVRDRTLVYMLALTGVRGSEIFSAPRDAEREGLTWESIDLNRGVATVFGKSRQAEEVPIHSRVCDVLDRHKTRQRPASAQWPVFITRHPPSLYQSVRSELSIRGWTATDIDTLLSEEDALPIHRTEEISPPALSTNGARNRMQTICREADLDIDGEYLKPHGGRRSFGSELYSEDPVLAQEALRHKSIETTHAAYRDQQAAEHREEIESVFEDV